VDGVPSRYGWIGRLVGLAVGITASVIGIDWIVVGSRPASPDVVSVPQT
jgi:hypothetical protein